MGGLCRGPGQLPMEVPLHQGVDGCWLLPLGSPGEPCDEGCDGWNGLVSVPRFTRPLKEDAAILT